MKVSKINTVTYYQLLKGVGKIVFSASVKKGLNA